MSLGINRLLASVPPDVQRHLESLGSRVALKKTAVLIEAGARQTHVYFPRSGLLSLQTTTHDANSVEVAMVGRGGVTPPLAAVGPTSPAYTAVVTIAGEALQMSADLLRTECERCPVLQRALIEHWHAVMCEIALRSACLRFHSARQRLAQWLLMASDRIQSSRLEVTQGQLSAILGLSRTRVSGASLALQDAGAIRARRGRIQIVDRARLQSASCACHP